MAILSLGDIDEHQQRNKDNFVSLALATSYAAVAAEGEISDSDRIAQYRDMISDGNPADFDEMAGEELWKTAEWAQESHPGEM